jgi:hypothetical protein
MTRFLVCLFVAAAVVAANPYVITFLSEVSTNPAHQFVELHCAPTPMPTDLGGWRIVTSQSVCTLTCQLQQDEFLVVDSAALAQGDIGRGAIHINPLGDSVVLVTDSGPVADKVHFPRYPTGYDSAPLPPATGSIAFRNYDDFEGQSMNWYVDSTPTPGWENDDYGLIAGTVTGTGGDTLEYVRVTASGANGHSHCGLYQQSGYYIRGLGAGTYQVKASVYHQGHNYVVTYPESVAVGYAQYVSDMDIVIPLTGAAETPSTPPRPLLRVSGRTLLLSDDGTAPVDVQLYDQVGARVRAFHLGLVPGEKRIELPATLAPGVYFATTQKEVHRSAVKVVLW